MYAMHKYTTTLKEMSVHARLPVAAGQFNPTSPVYFVV